MSTNTLPMPASTAFGRAFPLAGNMLRWVAEAVHAYRARKDLALLAGFDDRMLADIGLTRGDVRDAAAVVPWRDPTAILVDRAGERRRAARPRVVIHTPPMLVAPPTVPDIDAWSGAQFPARSRYY